MSRNVQTDRLAGVVDLDSWRRQPSELQLEELALARRARMMRRRAVSLSVLGALVASCSGIAWASSRDSAPTTSVYCGFGVVGEGDGSVAVVDQAAHSQHLPVPDNMIETGDQLNHEGIEPGDGVVMWIYHQGSLTHVAQDTVQVWPNATNPCPAGPQERPLPLVAVS